MFAAQEHLSNLVLIVDYNEIQALGFSKDIENLAPLDKKMEEFGWSAKIIDGHSETEIREALKAVPFNNDKPSVIIAHTTKCKGIDYLENTVESHYRFVPDEKLESVIEQLKEM
jgi:transketolase